MRTIKKIKIYLRYMMLSIVLGIICGLIGTAFSKVLELVTTLRTQNGWLLYLLILGGLLSVALYKLLRVGNAGVMNVFDSAKSNSPLPHGLPVAVFCGSALSHLCGASTGREGAALQIGGGVANILARLFKLDDTSRKILLLCGMAALFSALFGTPLAAAVFVIEIIATRLCFVAIAPILMSSLIAYNISISLGVHAERFNIDTIPQITLPFILKILLITVTCVAAAFVWCGGLKLCKCLAKNIFKNEFLRISIGGGIIILLTILIGNRDYNGGGVDVITRVFEGTVRYEAFALKLIFTVICVSVGFKGGEIVPTLFIGATLGGALAILLNLPLGICAAVGMAVLFGSCTKCPIATIFLCCEMFGLGSALIISAVVIISTVLSHFYKGLYNNKNNFITCITKKGR